MNNVVTYIDANFQNLFKGHYYFSVFVWFYHRKLNLSSYDDKIYNPIGIKKYIELYIKSMCKSFVKVIRSLPMRCFPIIFEIKVLYLENTFRKAI